jgi:hypothetical protein
MRFLLNDKRHTKKGNPNIDELGLFLAASNADLKFCYIDTPD